MCGWFRICNACKTCSTLIPIAIVHGFQTISAGRDSAIVKLWTWQIKRTTSCLICDFLIWIEFIHMYTPWITALYFCGPLKPQNGSWRRHFTPLPRQILMFKAQNWLLGSIACCVFQQEEQFLTWAGHDYLLSRHWFPIDQSSVFLLDEIHRSKWK